jgi:2-hydroxychromene-2-carboxylate isomerase
VLEEAELDARALMELVASPGIKQALIEATEAAVARGVFGAPTLFIAGHMFFGQDRLDFVEELLRG